MFFQPLDAVLFCFCCFYAELWFLPQSDVIVLPELLVLQKQQSMDPHVPWTENDITNCFLFLIFSSILLFPFSCIPFVLFSLFPPYFKLLNFQLHSLVSEETSAEAQSYHRADSGTGQQFCLQYHLWTAKYCSKSCGRPCRSLGTAHLSKADSPLQVS